MKKKIPLVSVVVTTKNEEKNIENCLRSIVCQTYPRIEILLVDNYSEDRTCKIALTFTSHVYQKGPERSAQRNLGMIEKASGQYVMFIDADMVLAPGLINACVNEISKRNCAALYISEIILGTTYWCRVRRFERGFYDATVIDSARFYNRDLFKKAGGFDEKIDFGEEWDIDKEIKLRGGKISLLPSKTSSKPSDWPLTSLLKTMGICNPSTHNVIYHNESNFNFSKYVSKKGEYAKGFDKYIQKWGKNDPDLKKQFGLLYRYFIVFFENNKWKKIGKHIHLFIGMFFLRFCVGLKYLQNRKKGAN